MANITLMGASYTDVPAVTLPQTGGGTVTFYENGGGTPAISVVDTTDSHGGTVREITALDISDTTAVASDVAQGKYFYTAQGVKTAGTGSGGSPSATQHSIYFEFSDSTNTTINAWYDDSFISDAITATEPTTYGQKTVTLAQLDGVTWYEPSQETWETLEEGTTNINSDTPYNLIWLSDLASVYPTAGTVYRITINDNEYRCTAQTATTSQGNIVCVGNPKYSGGSDDGSSIPFNFYNVGWGALVGDTELPVSTIFIKIERLVS